MTRGRPRHKRGATVIRNDLDTDVATAVLPTRAEMMVERDAAPITYEIPTIGRLLQDGRVILGTRLSAIRNGGEADGREMRDLMTAVATIQATEEKASKLNMETMTRDDMRSALRAELDRLDAEANASVVVLPAEFEDTSDEA